MSIYCPCLKTVFIKHYRPRPYSIYRYSIQLCREDKILGRVNLVSQMATLILLVITAVAINPSVEMIKYLFLLSDV
ncbi:MAG: hypothetical protein QXX61_02575 [Ignisphaera sp.]